MTDADLRDFLSDTRDYLDRELADAAPDLAASVARAHEIDPSAVPAHAVHETAALAPIAQLRPRTRRNTPVPENMSDRSALAPFAAALRDQLDVDLARLLHRGALASASGPDVVAAVTNPVNANTNASSVNANANANAVPATAIVHATVPAPSTSVPAAVSPAAAIDLASRRRRTIAAGAVALAAAVLLTLGLRGAFEARPARLDATPGAAALVGQQGGPDGGQAVRREQPGVARESALPAGSRDVAPVSEDSHDIGPVPEDSREAITPVPEDSRTSAPTNPPRPRPKRPVTALDAPEPTTPAEDPLTALDREAQALWQAGELRPAADKFAEIVRRAPGSRAAETAYGDLFALEHQLGGDSVRLWRAYLKQFPRGRYADDARAGVCRRESSAGQATCWSDYLEHHPDGAHRREAAQATTTP